MGHYRTLEVIENLIIETWTAGRYLGRFRTVILMMSEPRWPSLDYERQSAHIMVKNIGTGMLLSNVAVHGNDLNEAPVDP